MILGTLFEKLFKFREVAQSKRPGADEGFDPHEKPFLDHLEDLRKTLFKIIVALFLTTIAAFVFHKQIFRAVLLPLKYATFDDPETGEVIATLADRISFIVLSPPEILMLSIKVSFFAGLIGAFPLLLFFIGEFVLPGLKQQEKKLIFPGIGAGFFLFLLGASFAFFLATPIALKFFYEFQVERVELVKPQLSFQNDDGLKRIGETSAATLLEEGVDALDETNQEAQDEPVAVPRDDVLNDETKAAIREYLMEILRVREGSELTIRLDEPTGSIVFDTTSYEKIQYRIGDYISFVTRLIIVFGLSFQLPVVVVILVKLELLTARVMRSTRAFAWIIMMVLSAIFTPPDIFTLGLLAGPLVILYEICIWIATYLESKRRKKEEAEEAERLSRLEKLYAKPAEDLSEEEKRELHQHEIAQYEAEHAHLYDDDAHHVPHDEFGHPIDPHEDHDHGHEVAHDEHGHPIDPDKVEELKGAYREEHAEEIAGDAAEGSEVPHDEHGHPVPFAHDEFGHPIDPHHDEEAHEPVQDWPDREDDEKQTAEDESEAPKPVSDSETPSPKSADPSDSEQVEFELESDHAEGSEVAEEKPVDDFDDPYHDEHAVCEPSGEIVNPNTASLEELMSLGIDEELAEAILENGPYQSFDDLAGIPGMTDDLLNGFIDRIVLE